MAVNIDRYTQFERWVMDEGLKITQQHLIPDVRTAELAPWDRTGVNATLLDLVPEPPKDEALLANQSTSRYLCEIPPGGTYRAEKHMYEEVFFVISGRGATSVWNEGSPKLTFEWQEGSAFAIPLNAWHEIYNASGDEPARLYSAFTAPMVFNLYGSRDFIFNSPVTFPERFDPNDETYFSGRSVKLRDRMIKTNFVPNVRTLGLDEQGYRGPSTAMHALLSHGHFICHVSEFPGQTYKKAHTADSKRTKAGLNSDVAYLFLSGEGYDLQWGAHQEPGPGVPFNRLDYKEGTLLAPGPGYHQHFNATPDPIRYLVLRFGSPEYVGGERTPNRQIEFEDEDGGVWETFISELAKRGLKPKMQGLKN